MPVVSVAGSALHRALIVAALIVGLVAMHHLVATGCAAVLGGHDHANAPTVAVSSSLSDHLMGGEFSPSRAEPQTAAGHESHPATAAVLGGAASLCLAIMAFLLVLRRPATWITAWRRERRVRMQAALPARPRIEQPPGLILLSISRT